MNQQMTMCESSDDKTVSNASSRLTAVLPLCTILLIQAIASLSLHNAAFRDEALYLWAGGQQLHHWQGGPPTEDFARFFSGTPFFYPVLGSLLDKLGGLEAARLFSLCCMLAATSAVYHIAALLYNRATALMAAVLFAGQGSVLFLGHFATYDALCLALLAGATVLAFSAGSSSTNGKALLVGCLLVLAVFAKYAGLLFVPTVLWVLAWETKRAYGWRRALLRADIAGSVVVFMVALLLVSDANIVDGLNYTTLDRVAVGPASRLVIAGSALRLGGGLVALAVVGAFLDRGRRNRPLLMVLLVSAFLVPIYHVAKFEALSLHKHMAYGSFFAAPLAGYAMNQLFYRDCSGSLPIVPCKIGRSQYAWFTGTAVCISIFALGLEQAHQQFQTWLNSDSYIRELRSDIRPGDRILAEVVEVPRYYLQDVVGPRQWSYLPWFDYTDAAGNTLDGQQAYQSAISAGYFDLVILHYSDEAPMARSIDADLKDGARYTLIAELPGSWIWRKKNGGSAPVDPLRSSPKVRALTVDEVGPGSQRSEVEHEMRAEQSRTGSGPGIMHWRDATDGGWFSFRVKTLPSAPQDLVCTYWGSEEGNRAFDILMDGRVIASQTLHLDKPGQFFYRAYPIPAELVKGKQDMTVRFQARPGAMAGGLFGCRVVLRN